jgi:hypothetical protein
MILEACLQERGRAPALNSGARLEISEQFGKGAEVQQMTRAQPFATAPWVTGRARGGKGRPAALEVSLDAGLMLDGPNSFPSLQRVR